MSEHRGIKVGDLRPSQLLFTFGVGSLLDLPHFSVLVMGLDRWDTSRHVTEVSEPRLLGAVRKHLGAQVKRLLLPPLVTEEIPGVLPPPEQMNVGVPVVPFPRWMRCRLCDRLAPLGSGHFQLVSDPYRPERTRYVHANCSKGNNPAVIPVRFLLACSDGHLSDFPWVEYAHRGPCNCRPVALKLYQVDPSGDASDTRVRCETCSSDRSLGDAFGDDAAQHLPPCAGSHPHIPMVQEQPCQKGVKTILLAASNSWFPISLSALAIPRSADQLAQLVDDEWGSLGNATSLEVVSAFRRSDMLPDFVGYSDDEIWAAVQQKQSLAASEVQDTLDLRTPEWEVLSNPGAAPNGRDFAVRAVAVPDGWDRFFSQVVLVERVREVRALVGFTRLESPEDLLDPGEPTDITRAPLSRHAPAWVPASEIRGEGVFLQFREDAMLEWCARDGVLARERDFRVSHWQWRHTRHITPEDANFPGMRYVLVHSFSHALMRQLSLECGYTAASMRERLYSRSPQEPGGAMAGILIYTAAPDSEGTLGGLVSLGQPAELARHVNQALEKMQLCASDPLCAEHTPPKEGITLHGAACHACLFAPETSCERGNRYLDRAALVQTFSDDQIGFFGGE